MRALLEEMGGKDESPRRRRRDRDRDSAPPREKRGSKRFSEPEVVGDEDRIERKATILSQDLFKSLKDQNPDQLMMLNAMYATGDLVALGLMTQEELEEEAIYDENGRKMKPSGAEMAMRLIPPRLRAKVASDMIPFFLAKKKEKEEKKDTEDKPIVHFYIPENGRVKQ